MVIEHTIDGRLEGLSVGEAAHRQIVILDVAPERLHERGAVELAGATVVDQAGLRAVGRQRSEDVDAAALRRHIGHDRTGAEAGPGGADRQGGRAAALVQEVQVDGVLNRFPHQRIKDSRWAFAASWRAGSFCRWRTERLVRFQRKRSRRKSTPRCCGVIVTPRSWASQRTRWVLVHVWPRAAASSRSWPSASRSARVTVGGRPGIGRSGNAAKPPAPNALRYLRTVCSCAPRVWAIWGMVWPRSESRTISSRSRRRGATSRARARWFRSSRCSGVNRTRMILGMTGPPPVIHSTTPFSSTA